MEAPESSKSAYREKKKKKTATRSYRELKKKT